MRRFIAAVLLFPLVALGLMHCKARTPVAQRLANEESESSSDDSNALAEWGPVSAARPFTDCLKQHPEYDVADSVQCLPKDCVWEFVRSNSLQTACRMQIPTGCGQKRPVEVELPRVIARCNEGKFIATWSLCVGSDHVELGAPIEPNIYLWDIPLPLQHPKTLEPMQRNGRGESCNTCHFTEAADAFAYARFSTTSETLLSKQSALETCDLLESLNPRNPTCQLAYDPRDSGAAVNLARNIKLCKALKSYRRQAPANGFE